MEDGALVDAHLDHLRRRNLASTTIRHRRYELAALSAFLGTGLLAVTKANLDAWATSLLPLTPGTRYVKISRVHSFYVWANDEGLIAGVPTSRLARPKTHQGLPRPMPEERLEVALDGAPEDVRVWLILGAYAGLRCGEMASLTREQVMDTADPPAILVRGKGSKERIVPMCDRVVYELRAFGMPSRGFLFKRRDGRPGHPTPGRLSHMVNDWLHRQGVPDTAHACRHRFGTQVQRSTGDIQTTAFLLGHATLQTALIYAKFSDERAVAAVKSLDTPSPAVPPVRSPP